MNLKTHLFQLPGLCAVLWGALSLLAPCALAKGPTVSATIEPSEIQPGGFALYVITIEEGNADEASPLVLPVNVELAHPLPSTGRPQTGGRFQYASTVTWQITSEVAGTHTIPAQEIHINGVPYKTNATKLVVKSDPDAGNQLEPLMTLEAAKRQIYVGEVIPVTVNLYAHRHTFVRRIGLIELPKDNFAIQRFPTQPNESVITIGNAPYRAFAYQSTLSALKPGKFKLGPAAAEVILDIPSSSREPFLNPLLNQMEPRKVRPSCNEIDIQVIPLPEEGRPKDFKGIVGDFEITMTAEPKNLSVGDPISVDITITGTGNFDALMMPAMVETNDWKLYPPKRYNTESPNDPADTSGQHLGFSQVIVPKAPFKNIPSFEFSFFSPSKKQYVTLRTKPVAIQVKGVAPAPAPASPAAKGEGPSVGKPSDELEKVPPVKPLVTDILTVMPTQASLLASRPALWRNKRFLTANAIALGGLALLIVGRLASGYIRERRSTTDVTTRQLWRDLQARGLSREQFYTLAARYLNYRHLTGSEVQPILERHEQYSFSLGAAEAAQEKVTAEEKASVLAALKSAPAIQA